MKELLAVSNSDQVALDGTRFTVGALESGLDQWWRFGLPSHLSHDRHRPFAWAVGLALHIEPSLVRATNLIYVPETIEEQERIAAAIHAQRTRCIDEEVAPHLPELESRLSKHLSGECDAHYANCVALVQPALARRAFADVFQCADEDGLVPLAMLSSKLNLRAPGVFERGGLLLFAHPYLRRSLSRLNSLNVPFLEALSEVEAREGVHARLCLDEHMVGLAETYSRRIEMEYWWGPRFSEDLTSIKPGVCRHEGDELLRLFHGVSATEFFWYEQGGLRCLECEEIRDLPTVGVAQDAFGCRYVHCLVDPLQGTPTHLDGAIRLYDEASMLERMEVNLRHASRHTRYTKLWRVDGPLPVPAWKALVTHYYRDNRLVGEYLGGVDNSDHIAPHPVHATAESAPLSAYVPCNLEAGDGIRLALSYHERTEEAEQGHLVKPLQSLLCGSDDLPYVEADTVDLVKALRRMGEEVQLPDGVNLVAFEDTVINFPLLLHLGPRSPELANRTQKAIGQLCEAWIRRGDDRVVTYTVGIQYADRDVYISVAGHVQDLDAWLKSEESVCPADASRFGAWCEAAAKAVSAVAREAKDIPPLREMLGRSGVLHFARRFTKPSECHLRYEGNARAIIGDVCVEGCTQEVSQLIDCRKLRVSCAFLVRESTCSRCGAKPYHRCDCSKYLDPGVVEEISDARLLGAFWTNRHAQP
jgi:hypothetical protein